MARTARWILLALVVAEAAVAQTSPPPAPPVSETPAPPAGLAKVVFKGGQELVGSVVSRDDTELVLEVGGAGRLRLPLSAIDRVEEVIAHLTDSGELWPADPNRTRYLYGPSAMMMRQGEMSFSQKELAFSTFAYGLTDHVSLQVGSVIPALFVENGLNVIGAVKVGTPVGRHFHLAGGVQALFLPNIGNNESVGGGFVFATGTVGNIDRHLSLSVGRPFLFSSRSSAELGDFIATLSGNLRVARSIALISESWLMPDFSQRSFMLASGAAVRVMGDHIAADIGLVWPVTQEGFVTNGVPIPWLDFTYNF